MTNGYLIYYKTKNKGPLKWSLIDVVLYDDHHHRNESINLLPQVYILTIQCKLTET